MSRKPKTTRRLVAVLSTLFIVAATLAVTIPAPRDVRVTTHKISWPHPDKARVVHLTDLHVGLATPEVVLDRAIEETVRAKPDLVVLTHHPKTADEIAKYGGRLILAGHLHGGQIDIPKVTDAIARLSGKPYIAGFYSVGGSLLYVNAGLGSAVVRARAGPRATPEVAVFDLKGKNK